MLPSRSAGIASFRSAVGLVILAFIQIFWWVSKIPFTQGASLSTSRNTRHQARAWRGGSHSHVKNFRSQALKGGSRNEKLAADKDLEYNGAEDARAANSGAMLSKLDQAHTTSDPNLVSTNSAEDILDDAGLARLAADISAQTVSPSKVVMVSDDSRDMNDENLNEVLEDVIKQGHTAEKQNESEEEDESENIPSTTNQMKHPLQPVLTDRSPRNLENSLDGRDERIGENSRFREAFGPESGFKSEDSPYEDSFEEPAPEKNVVAGPSFHPYLAGYRRQMRHAAFLDQVMTSEADESVHRAMSAVMQDAALQEQLVLEKTARPWIPGLDLIGKTVGIFSNDYVNTAITMSSSIVHTSSEGNLYRKYQVPAALQVVEIGKMSSDGQWAMEYEADATRRRLAEDIGFQSVGVGELQLSDDVSSQEVSEFGVMFKFCIDLPFKLPCGLTTIVISNFI